MFLTTKFVFWACVSIIAYNYVGYPILLFVLDVFAQVYSDLLFFYGRKSRRVSTDTSPQPRIAIILSAFNEESVIEERVNNLLSIDYPANLIEILVGLDAPTDSTADVLRSVDSARLRIVHFHERRGKLRVIHELARLTTADILVFTDANTHFEPNCVRNLIRHFSDRRVGVVSGEELRTAGRDADPAGESLYWKYESALKVLESRLRCLHSANGSVYAIRRELFHPPLNIIVEDFQIPLAVRFQGYLVKYDPEATALEEIAPTLSSQFERRIRIGAGNFQTLFGNLNYLNPLRGRPAFAYWSHRVFRWLVPLLLIVIFVSSFVLFSINLYRFWFILQTLFYLLATIGYLREKRNKFAGICTIPLHFCCMNVALSLGFVRFLRGRQGAAWKVTPRGIAKQVASDEGR